MTAELERRIRAKEMKCFCRLLGISYKDHITSKATVPHDDLLAIGKSGNLSGMGMSQGHQDFPKQSCKEQHKETEREEVREGGGKITLPNGQERR